MRPPDVACAGSLASRVAEGCRTGAGGRARSTDRPVSAHGPRSTVLSRSAEIGLWRFVRGIARDWAEAALVGAGAVRVARRARRGRTIVLAYHNIVPDDVGPVGERSLHLPRSRFARQLDTLSEHADVVSLAAALNEPPEPGGRLRVAITFDDAYRGAVTLGVAEAAARGMPATIFVAPAFVGGRSFWWDVAADQRTGELRPELRERLLTEFRGEDREVRAWLAASGASLSDPPACARAADEAELAEAARIPGITIGSHSWGHSRLDLLSRAELDRELNASREWLAARFGAFRPWLAIPYGHGAPSIAEAARSAGYEAALCIGGGFLEHGCDRFAAPRLNVSAGMSARGLALRIAGAIRP